MKHHQPRPISQYPTTTRIEAFSDGVIAIIVTIMVLELKVPQLAETFSREEFWQAMEHLAPKLIAYAMSFLIVAIFWVNHHNFFHLLKKSDGKLVWYNNFLLFTMSLIPFATAFLGEHPNQPEASAMFGIVLALAGASFPFMGHYCLFRSDLVHDDISRAIRRKIYRRSFPGVLLYSSAIGFSFVSPWLAWAIFFIVPAYYFMPQAVNE